MNLKKTHTRYNQTVKAQGRIFKAARGKGNPLHTKDPQSHYQHSSHLKIRPEGSGLI